jgi:hypothetical protein
MVAGSLFAGETCVFGKPGHDTDWAQVFGESRTDWDGHCWIVCDDYIVDASVFRTAYSTQSPPALACVVREGFGE